MTGLPSNIPMQIPSVPKTKGATTAVQSCLPRSAVVANLFTSSRGGSESRRAIGLNDGDANGVSGLGRAASVEAFMEGPTVPATAGVAPGPREALSDPVFFNAALHREME